MTVRELLNFAIKKLSKSSNSPSLDAEVLLSHLLDKPKEYLLTNPNQIVAPRVEKQFNILLHRRLKGWPVAYLNNQKEFFGLKFYVDKHVLIPRPETEGLVELVLAKVKSKKEKLKILDLGTGSGAIIITLAKKASSLRPPPSPLLFASDISKSALEVAKRNAKQHKVKITFKLGSLRQPWPNQIFDIIVANLPYGWKQWKNNTSADTIGLKFEPPIALFTEDNGLKLIKDFLVQVSKLKHLPNLIILEFDPRQIKQIKKLAHQLLPAYKIKISKDLAGRDRYAVLSRTQASGITKVRTRA